MRLLFVIVLSSLSHFIFAQGCCSGGAGSPIAGGAAAAGPGLFPTPVVASSKSSRRAPFNEFRHLKLCFLSRNAILP